MLHEVARAIAPSRHLSQALREWNQIAVDLAAPTRTRTPQLAAFFD